MNKEVIKTCFLTTSIKFLTPEPDLFKNNLHIHKGILCDTYNIDRPHIFNELQDKLLQYDIYIVDTWVTLLESQFNTGEFRKTHLYKYGFNEGRTQLNRFRQWLIPIMQKDLKNKLFILYAGTFDFWRIDE